jgi:putative endonuclease
MYYVYVLHSDRDGMFYTGSTNDLKRRLSEHNDGRVGSTVKRRPLRLIYYEACVKESDARAREKYLKSGMGKRYIKNRLKHHLEDL